MEIHSYKSKNDLLDQPRPTGTSETNYATHLPR
jgi:hypothetical protein